MATRYGNHEMTHRATTVVRRIWRITWEGLLVYWYGTAVQAKATAKPPPVQTDRFIGALIG